MCNAHIIKSNNKFVGFKFMEEQEKLCSNCEHFKRYYVKSGDSFSARYKGGCYHFNSTKKMRDKCCEDFVCEKWEEREKIITDEEERVDVLIRNVYSNLHELSGIIKKK